MTLTISTRIPYTEVIVPRLKAKGPGHSRPSTECLRFITKPIGDSALFQAVTRAQQCYTSRKQIKDYTRLLENENARTSQELPAIIAFRKNLIASSMDGLLGCNKTGRAMIF
jgi:two-component system, NtrC family, sensor kinase